MFNILVIQYSIFISTRIAILYLLHMYESCGLLQCMGTGMGYYIMYGHRYGLLQCMGYYICMRAITMYGHRSTSTAPSARSSTSTYIMCIIIIVINIYIYINTYITIPVCGIVCL